MEPISIIKMIGLVAFSYHYHEVLYFALWSQMGLVLVTSFIEGFSGTFRKAYFCLLLHHSFGATRSRTTRSSTIGLHPRYEKKGGSFVVREILSAESCGFVW